MYTKSPSTKSRIRQNSDYYQFAVYFDVLHLFKYLHVEIELVDQFVKARLCALLKAYM